MTAPQFAMPASFSASAGQDWYVGIDPGLEGAIGAVNHASGRVVAWSMPLLAGQIDLVAVRDILNEMKGSGGIGLCVIERSQVMPKQGAVSGFTIGRNYGLLQAALLLCEVRHEEVRPADWKRLLQLTSPKKGRKAPDPDPLEGEALPPKPSKAAAKKALKQISVAAARRLFPGAVFRDSQDGIAEGLLMAEAARRLHLTGAMAAPSHSKTA